MSFFFFGLLLDLLLIFYFRLFDYCVPKCGFFVITLPGIYWPSEICELMSFNSLLLIVPGISAAPHSSFFPLGLLVS